MPRSLCLAALLALVGCAPATAPTPSQALSSPTAVPPSPTTSIAPSASPNELVSRLAGYGRKMDAGTYIYDKAFPHVTFDLPRGWYLDEAMPRHFGIRPKDMPVEDTFIVWFEMHLASKDPSCPEEPRPGEGHSASDLEARFQSNPGLVTTRLHHAGVGGLQGHVFDVSLASSWKGTCPFSNGHPTVPLFVDDDVEGEPAFWGVGGKERIRMIVLDDQHAGNVLITFDSTSGTTVDAIEAAAEPVLESFHFDVGA